MHHDSTVLSPIEPTEASLHMWEVTQNLMIDQFLVGMGRLP